MVAATDRDGVSARYNILSWVDPAFADSRLLARGLCRRGLLEEDEGAAAVRAAFSNQLWTITMSWYLGVCSNAIEERDEVVDVLRYLWDIPQRAATSPLLKRTGRPRGDVQ